jgi:sec-independent protein translocase protein TatC
MDASSGGVVGNREKKVYNNEWLIGGQMGDRDGDDERESEGPVESPSGDSTDDEQRVPSSTAADAKSDNAESGEDIADDANQSDEEATVPGDDESDLDEADDGSVLDEADLDPAARRDQVKGAETEDRPRGPHDAKPPHQNEGHEDDDTVGDPPDNYVPASRRENDRSDEDDHAGPSSDATEYEPGPPDKGDQYGSTVTAGEPDHEEFATAPDDEEMPLTEHVEEMALRFLAVGLVMFGVAGIVVFYADELINFLWYSFLGNPEVCPGLDCEVKPRVYHPLSLVLARLKVSSLVGLIVALPVGVYQTYRFMRPGLYPRERRYYLAAVPTSLVLAAAGVGFAYFAVLPSLFGYFTEYSEQAALTAFGLTETFNLIVLMLGFFALIFQIPLLVMLAIMMGVTTRQWLEDRRLYFWGGFAAVAFLFSPDPTGMAPLIVAVTMIVLFEGTLTMLRWTGTGSPIPTAEEADDARPIAWLLAGVGGYLASAGPLPPGYYDYLPATVTDILANTGGPIATPAIIAAVLIVVFEISGILLRRFGTSRRALKARLAFDSARIPVWFAAVVVGYFGSPDPTLVLVAEDLALPPMLSVAVGIGLVVLYELFVAILHWREGSEAVEQPVEA